MEDDLASAQPDRVSEMSKMWADWAQRVGVVRYDDLKKMKGKDPAAQARERENRRNQRRARAGS